MNTPSIATSALLAGFFLMISGTAHAGSSSADSVDVLVDTRQAGDIRPTISFRKVTKTVMRPMLSPGNPNEPIRVDGSKTAALLAQPVLTQGPGWPGRGVIADGITPLLVVVSAPANMTTDRTYRILVSHSGAMYYGDSLMRQIRILTPVPSVGGEEITLGPSNPHAFLLVEPIDPQDFDHTAASSAYEPLVIALGLLEEASNRNVAYESFAVRKPPVVLVHGFNSDKGTWSDEFLAELKKERGDDFVIPINYGIGNNKELNTFGNFKTLLGELSDDLYLEMESAAASW